MAGHSLVQVGSSLTINNSDFENVTYGCDNFESVLIRTKKGTSTGTTNMANFYVTVQAGTETILNRVPHTALTSLNKFEAGTGVLTAFGASGSIAGEACFEIDTGTHYLDKGAELSVSLQNSSGSQIKCEVYAKVNGISVPSPQKWLWRTDNAFMLPLVESLYAFDLQNTPDFLDHAGNATIQYGTENILVPFNAGCAVVNADTIGDDRIDNMALLYDGIPRSMQINTGSSDIGFLAQVKEVASVTMVQKARTWIPSKFKSLSKKERVVLAQGN